MFFLFILSLLFIINGGKVLGQCLNAEQLAVIEAPEYGEVIDMGKKSWCKGGYIKMFNCLPESYYVSESETHTDYITVRRGSYDGEVVAHGVGSVLWIAYSDEYYIHYNMDNSCHNNNGVRHVYFSYAGKLPVKLSEFQASCKHNYTSLRWITESETNNHYFVLKKSNDFKEWREISRVEGSGNSSEKIDYHYNDYELDNSISYYQLTQIDYDGTTETFPEISSFCLLQESMIKAYPNPTTDYINFSSEITEAELINSEGRIVKTITTPRTRISLSDLGKGTYYLKTSFDVFKIIKQ